MDSTEYRQLKHTNVMVIIHSDFSILYKIIIKGRNINQNATKKSPVNMWPMSASFFS